MKSESWEARMRRLKEAVSTIVPLAILVLVFVVMFEIEVFPRGHRYMGYLIGAYLALCMAILTGWILRDVYRWLINRR